MKDESYFFGVSSKTSLAVSKTPLLSLGKAWCSAVYSTGNPEEGKATEEWERWYFEQDNQGRPLLR